MILDQTDLQQTFDEAVRIFNGGRYDDLRPLLDPAIVWKRLHHRESLIGANAAGDIDDDVVQWLNKVKLPQKPQFLPAPQRTTMTVADNVQKISGPGKWKSSNEAPVENLEYIFTFARSNAGAPWLLVNAFGHIIS
jgi:hypothetical protein